MHMYMRMYTHVYTYTIYTHAYAHTHLFIYTHMVCKPILKMILFKYSFLSHGECIFYQDTARFRTVLCK